MDQELKVGIKPVAWWPEFQRQNGVLWSRLTVRPCETEMQAASIIKSYAPIGAVTRSSPLYAALQPAREPLTLEQIYAALLEACVDGSGPPSLVEFVKDEGFDDCMRFARAIERALGIVPKP